MHKLFMGMLFVLATVMLGGVIALMVALLYNVVPRVVTAPPPCVAVK